MKLPKLPKLPSLKSLHLPSRITMERLLIVSAAALVVVGGTILRRWGGTAELLRGLLLYRWTTALPANSVAAGVRRFFRHRPETR